MHPGILSRYFTYVGFKKGLKKKTFGNFETSDWWINYYTHTHTHRMINQLLISKYSTKGVERIEGLVRKTRLRKSGKHSPKDFFKNRFHLFLKWNFVASFFNYFYIHSNLFVIHSPPPSPPHTHAHVHARSNVFVYTTYDPFKILLLLLFVYSRSIRLNCTH